MFNSLGSLLSQRAGGSPVLRSVEASMVVEKANQALVIMFGPEIEEFVRVSHFKNSVLTIACLSSVSASEMKLREPEIVAAVNKAVGKSVVTRLRCAQ